VKHTASIFKVSQARNQQEKGGKQATLLAACFLLVPRLPSSSTLQMKAKCFSETSVILHSRI
jgi:hypothetical protein